MAQKKIIKKTKQNIKKKKWYSLHASKEFNNVKIGESYVENPEQLKGKYVGTNLGFVANDPKKQGYNVTFAIIETKGDIGVGELVEYSLSSSHLKRMVRKGTGKMEDSFVVTTKDGIKYRIKPVFVTRFSTHNSVKTALRKKSQEYYIESFKQINSNEVFTQIISNKLQVNLKQTLRKIYPVSVSEIKSIKKV